MYFDSLQAALTMDGHGAFVWTAYLLTLLGVLWLLLAPVLRRRRTLRVLSMEARREAGVGHQTGGGR